MGDIIDLEKRRRERFERETERLLKTLEHPVQRRAVESLLRAYRLMGEAMRK